MSYQDQDRYIHAKFGIDEIYVHEGLSTGLIGKLHQRAVFSLDVEDPIASKYVSHDMVLVFHLEVPSPSLVYRFLKFLDQDKNKKRFIESNTLLNEEELFSAIKCSKFILLTKKALLKKTYTPA